MGEEREKRQVGLSVYHHTHWDREWYQPFREYQVRLAEVVDAILEGLDNGSLQRFTLDGQTIVLEDYLEFRPWNREKLRWYVAEGRLSIGPWFVMPDEFLVSGESLVRNLKRGIETSKEWGCHRFTGYLPDTFGHSGDMPRIFRGFGIGTAMVWRGVAPQTSEFQWESRSGERVLTYHLVDGYFQNALQDPEPTRDQRVECLRKWFETARANAATERVLLPVGGDHLGPMPSPGGSLLREVFPEVEETTPADFLSELGGRLNGHKLPTLVGELRDNSQTFLLAGVFSARLYLKQANRRLEHKLVREVEPLVALSQALCGPAPLNPVCELETAWTLLLQNHPHDSICGCSVDAVHRENEVRFDAVAQLCEAVGRRQRIELGRRLLPEADADHWLLFNLGDRPYSGVVPVREWGLSPDFPTALVQRATDEVVLEDGYLYDILQVPQAHKTMTERRGWIWAENIPPHGVLRVPKSTNGQASPKYQPVTVDASGRKMANDLLSVEVRDDGTLRVEDLKIGTVYENLHRPAWRPDQGDSYNAAPVPGSQTLFATLRHVQISTSGPLVASLTLTYDFPAPAPTLTTRITLMAGRDTVEFETSFVNEAPDSKLWVGFDTGAPVSAVIAETHFGTETRAYDPAYREEDAMPAATWKELPTNSGPIQRFVAANGHLFITEGLTDYEVSGNTLSLTLLRAFGYLSKGDTGVRGAQAGPPLPTPEGQCLGRPLSFRYAWGPQPESLADAFARADVFMGVVAGDQARGEGSPSGETSAMEQSLVSWDNPAVVSTSVRWVGNPANPQDAAGNRGLLLRLLNPEESPQWVTLQAGFPYASLWETDFLDEPRAVVESSRVELPPLGVQSFLFRVQ